VDKGVFTVLLDWGTINFNGDERWLEIHVRNPHDPGDTEAFVQMDPRQRLSVVPYAIHALNGGGGGGGSGQWTAVGNNITNTNTGFVGIGRSDPWAPGEMFGIESPVDGMTGMFIKSVSGFAGQPLYGYRNFAFEAYHYLSPAGTWGLFNSGQSMYFNILGNLGIGIETPLSKIAAAGVIESTSGGFKFPDGTVQVTAAGGGSGSVEELVMADSALNNTIEILASTNGAGTADGPKINIYNTVGARTFYLFGGKVSGADLSAYNAAGSRTVRMLSDYGDGGSRFELRMSDGSSGIKMQGHGGSGLATVGAELEMFRVDGTNTLTLYGDYQNSGESRVVTSVLEITGGADLSEHFDVAADGFAVDPGSVVSIDPESPGDLCLSTAAYDRRVAGIISGADGIKPGLLMGQAGTVADGGYPVALTGRVYCKVDASFGAVVPGDLLTTSPTPGHAMIVSDHEQAQGAILGKAMTSLASGQGLVLVLVSLQ